MGRLDGDNLPDSYYRPPQRHDPSKTHITGVCDDCGFIYDLYYGLDCPACVEVTRQQLRREASMPWNLPHVLIDSGTICRWDCPACEWEKQKPAVDWLEALYAIKDDRT